MLRLFPVLLLLGCEVQRATETVPDQARPDASLDASALPDGWDPEGGMLQAGGQWLLYLEDTDCLEAMGQTVTQHVWTSWRVELEVVGPAGTPGSLYLRQRMRMCAQEVSAAVAGLVTVVPAAVPRALPEVEVYAAVLGDERGESYVAEELVEVWGAAVGRDEPLPSDPADPSVVDQDGDGNPGVTLVLGTDFCDLYVVRRGRYRLAGEVMSPGRIEGMFWSKVEKNVLASTSPLCASPNLITDAPTPNRFVLARADGSTGTLDLDLDGDGDVTCDEMAQAEPVLRSAGVVPYDEPMHAVCE